MTEDEITILSAKAVGLKVGYSNNFGGYSVGEPYSKGEYEWNPIFSDRDTMHLICEKKINVSHGRDFVSATVFRPTIHIKLHVTDDLDRDNQIKLAVATCAAEIGKSMP